MAVKVKTNSDVSKYEFYDLSVRTSFRGEAKICAGHGLRTIRLSINHDNGYPHDGGADKNPYPHDLRADKDSYPHDSNNQYIILRLQLSFAMINVQLMLV